VPGPTASEYARGALHGLAAISIWSGWIVASRLGLKTSLTPWDITAIRFAVAGIILLPYLVKKGLAVERLGLSGLAAIVLGGVAVLVANAGLLYAPAAHAGALFPGVMPLQVAILAAFVLGEAFTFAKRIGFVLILAGALTIVWVAGGTLGTVQNIGHALFLAAGFLWACYTGAMRKARLFHAPWWDIALQAIVQGVLAAVLSLILYGRAVSILGASSGASFAALCPAMTALLAIPVLSEWPTLADWLAILLISAGVYFVSGGPLPARRVS
jgi:drug/metabolite transporter (DMT)-like permease